MAKSRSSTPTKSMPRKMYNKALSSTKAGAVMTTNFALKNKTILMIVLGLAFLGTMIWVIYHYASKPRHHNHHHDKSHGTAPSTNIGQLFGMFGGSYMAKANVGDAPKPNARGYYLMSWESSSAPSGDWDFGVWFSGETAGTTIQNQIDKVGKITKGAKYLNLGGGADSGIWSGAADFNAINSNLGNIKNKGWDGLCFDVEVCTPNVSMVDLFSDCFAKCRAAGLKVIVTISHVMPYSCQTGVGQGADLVNAWIKDKNINYISPQMYSSGDVLEPSDMSVFKSVESKIMPSIPRASDWPALVNANIGLVPNGYIIWKAESSAPTNNYCGTSWENANATCGATCPTGQDSECPTGQSCYASVTGCGGGGGATTNYCGTSWENANSTCGATCPSGQDSDCPSGQSCYASITGCGGGGGATRNYCGTSWENANSTCGAKCPGGQDNECPTGLKCFGNATGCPPN